MFEGFTWELCYQGQQFLSESPIANWSMYKGQKRSYMNVVLRRLKQGIATLSGMWNICIPGKAKPWREVYTGLPSNLAMVC